MILKCGEGIKARRVALGMTREMLSTKSGVSIMTIRRYEGLEREPRFDILEKLATAMDCTVSDLIYNETDTESNQGYKIVKKETYHMTQTGRADRIVLGRMDTKYGKQFVTWESAAYPQDDRPIEYFWGHYFSTENEARADYHKRLLEKYE